MDRKDDILVHLLVHGQLAGLAEGARAPLEVALERLLLSVNVGVLLKVLSKCEGLEAEDAHVLLDSGVGRNVSP